MFLDRTKISKNQPQSENNRCTGYSLLLPSNLDLPVRIKILEVLVPEDQDLPLSGKQSKFVETCVAQFGNLDTFDFCANVGADIIRRGAGTEEVWFLGVSAGTWVNVICNIAS